MKSHGPHSHAHVISEAVQTQQNHNFTNPNNCQSWLGVAIQITCSCRVFHPQMHFGYYFLEIVGKLLHTLTSSGWEAKAQPLQPWISVGLMVRFS
jgi:hypothetical protein